MMSDCVNQSVLLGGSLLSKNLLLVIFEVCDTTALAKKNNRPSSPSSAKMFMYDNGHNCDHTRKGAKSRRVSPTPKLVFL